MAIPESASTPSQKSWRMQSTPPLLSSDPHMSSQMLPNAKLLDNHLLIDPVAAVYDRSMPEYQGLRKLVVGQPAHHSGED